MSNRPLHNALQPTRHRTTICGITVVIVCAIGAICATGCGEKPSKIDQASDLSNAIDRTEHPVPTDAQKSDSPKPTSTRSVTNNPTASISPETTNDAPAPSPSKPKSVPYKPGITLNYEKMRVEIDAKVVLRVGELELLAWSIAPTPKEHETILAMRAKPSAIYEALGLIGLTPGSPPRYDWESKTFHPATGDRVDVLVAYEHNGTRVEHSICDWAIDKDRDAPMAKRSWVFAGSHKTENGAFAADIEGTAVTVVDFPSSLLSLADSHSDSNDALWLVANTDAIPETGTTVTLILQAAQ